MRALLIDDDKRMSQVIKLALERDNMVCDIADHGEDGLEFSSLYPYDIVILDLMLPDMSGHDVLRKIREEKLKAPVLILSGIGEPEEKIKGLGFGADDYVTKPFNIDELVARIKAIVRRSKGHSVSVIQVGELKIDIDQHISLIGNVAIPLTNKEQSILESLALRAGKPVAKDVLLDHLYDGMDEPSAKIIDVFICKIRNKLKKVSDKAEYISTVWGSGYLLQEQIIQPSNVDRDVNSEA
jgi:two-component system cell cycle response regulator CtrA